MNEKEHIELHIELQKKLDELVADFIYNTGKRPSETKIIDLMEWSYEQTQEKK